MADADGATTFSELGKLQNALRERVEVVVGSRNHLTENANATVTVFISKNFKRI